MAKVVSNRLAPAAHQAISCAIYLEERGVKSDRLGITSYGSQQPLPNVVGNDDAARRKNARVEFWILQPDPAEDVSKNRSTQPLSKCLKDCFSEMKSAWNTARF